MNIPTYEEIVSAKLISHTVAVDSALGEDLTGIVSYCGRVSNPKNQMNLDTADKLIKYLIKHKHWSPFEMASVCLEITTTRDIGRQLLRHGFRFQEFSQRYADPTSELGFCLRECRFQDADNRQSSLEVDESSHEDLAIAEQFEEYQRDVIYIARKCYQKMTEAGVAKEQARAFLPEGNTVSRLYVHGFLRNWIHYIEVRSDPSTQKEHRLIAIKAAEAMLPIFPLIENFLFKEQVNG